MKLKYLLVAIAAVALLTGCKNDQGMSSQTPSSALVSTNGTNNLSFTQTNNAVLNGTNDLVLSQTNGSAPPTTAIAADQATTNGLSSLASPTNETAINR